MSETIREGTHYSPRSGASLQLITQRQHAAEVQADADARAARLQARDSDYRAALGLPAAGPMPARLGNTCHGRCTRVSKRISVPAGFTFS